jgi:hypothetical protein
LVKKSKITLALEVPEELIKGYGAGKLDRTYIMIYEVADRV